MRITLDLPQDLLEKAMLLSQAKTETQVVTMALQQFVGKSAMPELKKFKGKIPLDIDLDVTRNRD